MKLEFLNELAESRLFQYRDDFRNRSARDLADLLFVTILILEIVRYRKESSAKSYATKTMVLSEFDGIKPGMTDLYNLISVLSDQGRYDSEISTNLNISVPVLQLKRYLRDVSFGKQPGIYDREFLLKLEDYLRINDGELRYSRRVIAYWTTSTALEKETVSKNLLRFMRSKAPMFDLLVDASRAL